MEKRETQERKCRKISLIFLKVKNRTRNKEEKMRENKLKFFLKVKIEGGLQNMTLQILFSY